MYHETFDDDWGALAREDAMFRAYALGVDAALGTEHPEEVERLARETSRPLVQLAYDEGKSAAEERLAASGTADPEAVDGPDGRHQIWERLVESRRDDADAFEMVRVEPSRLSLPNALSRPELLERRDRSVTAVRLPRFLLE